MTPLEQRLRAAAPDAFPPTPDLAAANWAAFLTPDVNKTAHGWPKRRWLVAALAALALPAAALAIPGVRHALGISGHITAVEVRTLPAPRRPPPATAEDVTTLHRGRATVTEIRGRYIVKFFTHDTRVRHVRVGAARGVYLSGGRHEIAVELPAGGAIPLEEDRGDALVFERRGTVIRIVGAGSLRAARRIAAGLR